MALNALCAILARQLRRRAGRARLARRSQKVPLGLRATRCWCFDPVLPGVCKKKKISHKVFMKSCQLPHEVAADLGQ